MKKDDERLYLSMQILTDYMDDQFSDYYFYRGNDPMVLEDVRLYYGQAEISEKFVYIVKPGYLQKAMENNCNIVLIGKVELPKITPQYHKSIIHIRLYANMMRSIYDYFLDSRNRMRDFYSIRQTYSNLYSSYVGLKFHQRTIVLLFKYSPSYISLLLFRLLIFARYLK